MRHLGDGPFHKGDPIWIVEADGSRRAGEYIGEREAGTWFGGPPMVFVLFTDNDSSGAVELDRVLARKA